MNIEIKLKKFRKAEDLEILKSMINSRLEQVKNFKINMEDIDGINLASFNSLVKLYVQLKRLNRGVSFINCSSPKMKDLISKTQLSDVFST